MEIKRQSRKDLSNKDLYFLVTAPDCKKLQELDGQNLHVIDWVIKEDVNVATGEINEVLTILTDNDIVYGTNSPTVIRTFTEIVECFGEDFEHILVYSDKSNKGRTFFQVKYVD